MGLRRADQDAEVARVRGELVAFRDACLPILTPPGTVGLGRSLDGNGPTRVTHRDWFRTTQRLIDALPVDGSLGRLNPAWFEFLVEGPQPRYVLREGVIEWRCGVGPFSDREGMVRSLLDQLGESGEPVEDPWAELQGRLTEVWETMMWLSLDDAGVHNALSTVLPLLVEIDLDFVLRALDSETWRNVVLEAPGLTPAERLRLLDRVKGYAFQNAVNNALLHVLGAMASNRFAEIPALMTHPNILGSYTHHMPYYLFSVLYAKVVALRDGQS